MATRRPSLTLVLGAGASRGVKYAHQGKVPSPLDGDFFDLLQRLEPGNDIDEAAVDFVLRRCSNLQDFDLRKSMERMFYTLHLRSYVGHKLLSKNSEREVEELIGNFARAVQSLLRAAHGTRHCSHHCTLLRRLSSRDTIISFNYDLVVERALRPLAEENGFSFNSGLYGVEGPTTELPLLLKLHGSSNWKLRSGVTISVRQRKWGDFDESPGYRGHRGQGTVFPIMLPFWDKRIEEPPWSDIWSRTAARLQQTDRLIIWGYSLPLTDVKSQELFRVALPTQGKGLKLCVIDPNPESRMRWRSLLPNAQFWEYQLFKDFLENSPDWWQSLNITLEGSCTGCQALGTK